MSIYVNQVTPDLKYS